MTYLKLSTFYLNKSDINNIYFRENIGYNLETLLHDNSIKEKINDGYKLYYVDCWPSNYEECMTHSIKLENVTTVLNHDIYRVEVD